MNIFAEGLHLIKKTLKLFETPQVNDIPIYFFLISEADLKQQEAERPNVVVTILALKDIILRCTIVFILGAE